MIENSENELVKKQEFLRTEIMEKGFDTELFTQEMIKEKGENALQLENWKFEELKTFVEKFQKDNSIVDEKNIKTDEDINKIDNKENNENSENKENKENDINNNKNVLVNPIKDDNNEAIEITPFVPPTAGEAFKKMIEQKKIEKINVKEVIDELLIPINLDNLIDDSDEEPDQTSPYNKYSEIVHCKSFEESELQKNEDLKIVVKNPKLIKTGILTSYNQYTIETKSMNFSTERKLIDFDWLYKKLTEFYPGKIIGSLPPNYIGLKGSSDKKIMYLNLYINSLAGSKFIRSTPIFYDFLSLPQQEFNKKKTDVYDKLKTPDTLNNFYTMDGTLKLKLSKKRISKIENLNEEIKKRVNAIDKVFNCLNTISNNFDTLIKNLNDLSLHFKNLKETYKFNGTISKGFELFKEFSLNWSNGFVLNRDYIRNDLKFFFQYMKKEIEDSIFKFEEFKSTKESYLNMFNKVNRLTLMYQSTEKESEQLKDLKTLLAFRTESLIVEFETLIERHQVRLANQIKKTLKNREEFVKNCTLFKL